jgi:hypothetical protein
MVGIVARHLDGNWNVCQNLLGLRHASSSLDTIKLASLIVDIVEHDNSLRFKNCVGTMRDAVNLNGAVLDKLEVFLQNSVDVSCFSHMGNRTGELLQGPNLARFMGFFCQYFGHSDAVSTVNHTQNYSVT